MFSVLSHPVSVALRRSSHYSNPPLLHKDHVDPRLPPPVHPRYDARTFPMDLSYKIKSLILLSWFPLLGAEGPACSLQNDAHCDVIDRVLSQVDPIWSCCVSW